MNDMRPPESQPLQPVQPPQPSIESDVQMPAGVPVAAVPVQPVGRGRSHRFRWAIAGSIVLIVALVTTAGAFVLSGAAGAKSLTASAAPKTSVMFIELRTDLPGDQHQKLANFMSKFPGFADRGMFESALDDIFNRITRSVSPDLAYTSAFKPWMEGEVSVAMLPLNGSALGMGRGMMTSATAMADAVVIVQLKDRAAAQTWITGELTAEHITTSSQTYAGETLYTLSAGMDAAYALTGADLLIGTTSAVKAAIDTKTGGSLADDKTYQAAMGSLSGDSLARFYMNPRTMVGGMLDAAKAMLGGLGMNLSTFSADQLPAWIAGSVRAESDRLVLEEHAPRTTTTGNNHASVLAADLPGDTVAAFEGHGIGKALSKAIDQFKAAAPSLGIKADQLTQIEQVIGLVGVDWISDVAVAVTDTKQTIGGGIVIQTPDAATARSKVALLTNLVALGGGALGIKSTTEAYKSASIAVLSLSGANTAGVPMEIGVTTKNNLIVIGYKDAFAKSVLDTTSANALSAQSDYSSVMNAVGSNNESSCYVNVPAIKDQLGKMAVNSSDWNRNYKPYFDHLGGFGCASIDGSTSTVRIVLMAR